MYFTLGFLVLVGLLWALLRLIGPALEHALARAAHYTTHFRYSDYAPVLVILAAGTVTAIVAGDAFLDLAESVHRQSAELQAADEEIHRWARTTHTSGATTFFTVMTLIGTPVGLGALVLIVSLLLAADRRWRWITYLVLTTGAGGLVNRALKLFFARDRPELAEALRTASGYSFPSGHAMGSTIVFGALGYLAFRALHSWRDRAPVLAFALAMIIAISASRIYLGVHWVSDVGAGIAAGAIWIVTTTLAYEASRRIRRIRSMRASRASPQNRRRVGR